MPSNVATLRFPYTRVLLPRTIRDDSRYEQASAERTLERDK